jgi:transcriptional regulator with XRE-family HTH domain
MAKFESAKNTLSLGETLRKKRKSLGLTLLQVTKKIKTSTGKMAESYLSLIEKNKKTPPPEVAEQLAKTLHLDVEKIKNLAVLSSLQKTAATSGGTVSISTSHNYIYAPKVIITVDKNAQTKIEPYPKVI